MTPIRPDSPNLPDTVPARMVNQYVFCPRLFFIEWVQAQFTSNDDVEEGLYLHRVVDREQGSLPDRTEAWANRRATSVSLSSAELGLAARLDLVESDNSEALIPVDYKKGKPAPNGEPWAGDRVQSLIQALLLRESGYEVETAEIWYAEVRQRVTIPVTDAALVELRQTLQELWAVASSPGPPPPLVNSPKCPRCSLVGICLPDETHTLQIRANERTALRRVMAPDPDSRPVYVTSQGATVGVRRGRLEIYSDHKVEATFRLLDVSQLCLFGNITVTAQATRELIAREAPILWFTFGGWFQAMTQALPGKNVQLRIAQFGAPPDVALTAAQMMIAGKIRNSRTLLRRNARTDVARTLAQLASLSSEAKAASTPATLLGLEGAAARLYFEQFLTMVTPQSKVDVSAFSFNGRARRPPPDALNSLLSFCYALLVKDLTASLAAIGFDPYFGVLHQPRFGRPALALDLAEEFRPLVAESVVLQVLNNGEVSESDFRTRNGSCQLEASGRKAVLRAYERRLEQEIIHPQFGYRVSYRRAMNVQGRILAGFLTGELPIYTPFVTR